MDDYAPGPQIETMDEHFLATRLQSFLAETQTKLVKLAKGRTIVTPAETNLTRLGSDADRAAGSEKVGHEC